jgi:polyisoprenoid-binding protein YceI
MAFGYGRTATSTTRKEPDDMTAHHLDTATALRPGEYQLDPQGSVVRFEARKFGLFTIRGTMRLISGTISIADPIEASAVQAVLAADTFHTPMKKRDEHVKGPRLLDVRRYPTIEFDSTQVARVGSAMEVRGMLTVHGTTRPAAVMIADVDCTRGGLRVLGTAAVDRREFGVTAMRGAASSTISLTIEVAGVPRQSSECIDR